MLALSSNRQRGYQYDDFGYGNTAVRHGSYNGGYQSCCPGVVDPLTYLALIAFIGIATYFFQELIAMSSLARKKRSIEDLYLEGRIPCLIPSYSNMSEKSFINTFYFYWV